MADAPIGFASQADGSAPVVPGGGFASQVAAPTAAPAVMPTGKTVNVVAPDGKTFGLDAAYLEQAKAQGYQVESAEHAGIRSYLEQNKGLGGAAKVALRGLLDEATFGVGDVVADKLADPYELAKFRALREQNTAADYLGRGAGFIASLFYGGEFFQGANAAGKAARAGVLAERALAKGVAAEAAYRIGAEAGAEVAKHSPGIARQILAHAADYGAQGLVFSAPKAAAQLLTGDPDKAAETWLYGAAGGAVLGGLVGGAKGLFGRMGSGAAAKALPAAAGDVAQPVGESVVKATAGKLAEEQAFKSLASNQASLKKAAREAINIPGGQRGIGRTLLDEKLVRRVGEDVEDYAVRLAEAKAAAGEAVGGMYRSLDELGADTGLSVKSLVQKMRDDVLRPLQAKPGFESVASKVEAYVNSFEEKAASGGWSFGSKDKITFERLHGVRADLDDLVFRNTGANPAEHIKELRAIRKMIQSELVEKGEEQAQKFGQEFASPLKELNVKYARLSAAEKAAADFAEVRKLTNRSLSPTDYGVGGLGALAGAMANPLGAVGGVAAAMGHKFLRENGNSLAATALDALSQGRGLAALEQAYAEHGTELARIPSVLDRMASGGSHATRDTMPVNILTRLLEAHDSKLDDHKGLMGFADNLASLATNPEKMQAKIEQAIAPLQSEAPEVAVAVGAKLGQVAQYLAGEAPKNPYAVPTPFVKPPAWRPTDAQLRDYKTKVRVALNPYAAIDALGAGTLTRAHVDALRAVAPKLYEEMVKRIADYGASGTAKPLPYDKRLKLSLMTGAPLDRSIAQISSLQAVYASKDASKVEGGGKMKLPATQQSDIARVSG